jgi:hypothetical protein
MTVASIGYSVELPDAVAWSRDSLDRGTGEFGSMLCDMLTARLDSFTAARLLVASEWSFLAHDLSASGYQIEGSAEVAVAALGELRQLGARTLVVESDMENRNDPGLAPAKAFLGERVERWVDLVDSHGAASSLLRTASWPLNAFVSHKSPGELGLSMGADLTEEFASELADSTVALINQVFDDEAYLILLRDF